MEDRATEVHELVRRADALLRKWKVDPPSPPVPSTVSAPTPASSTRRRFVAMDGLKPSPLSIETTYEDWIDFQKGPESGSKLAMSQQIQ